MRNGIDFRGGTYIIRVTWVIKNSTGLGAMEHGIQFTFMQKFTVNRMKKLISLSKQGLYSELKLKLFISGERTPP